MNNYTYSQIKKQSLFHDFDLQLILYLIFWYIGNYYYNIYNKSANNDSGNSEYSIIIATTQLGIGVLYSFVLWIVPDGRPIPKIYIRDLLIMSPAGLCSAIAHGSSVLSLASGGVVFGQIIKASEPVFVAFIGTIFYNKQISFYRWFCLIIIIIGVSLASLKENDSGSYVMDFTFTALFSAIIANIFAAVKSSENKKIMESKELIERIGSVSNQYAIMNIISFIISFPIMFIMKGHKLNEFNVIISDNNVLYKNIILSGITFYVYNELSTMTLKVMSPVSQSVANTAKRVIIIIGSSIVFNEKITTLKTTGCILCIGGVFADSVIDDIIKKLR